MARIVALPPDMPELEVTCSHCKAVVAAEERDLFQYDVTTGYDDWTTHHIGFLCPCCSHVVEVSSESIPDYVRYRLPEKKAWIKAHKAKS